MCPRETSQHSTACHAVFRVPSPPPSHLTSGYWAVACTSTGRMPSHPSHMVHPRSIVSEITGLTRYSKPDWGFGSSIAVVGSACPGIGVVRGLVRGPAQTWRVCLLQFTFIILFAVSSQGPYIFSRESPTDQEHLSSQNLRVARLGVD